GLGSSPRSHRPGRPAPPAPSPRTECPPTRRPQSRRRRLPPASVPLSAYRSSAVVGAAPGIRRHGALENSARLKLPFLLFRRLYAEARAGQTRGLRQRHTYFAEAGTVVLGGAAVGSWTETTLKAVTGRSY